MHPSGLHRVGKFKILQFLLSTIPLTCTMPELPEVETVRRGLDASTLQQTITGAEVLYPRSIGAPEAIQDFIIGVTGTTIQGWHRRGKYLLANLADAQAKPSGWLGVHLRMSGQLLWVAHGVPVHKHTRVILKFGDRQHLRFVDQRTFGQMWWVAPTQTPEQVISGLQRLGPEPFSEQFSLEYFREYLRDRKRPIKNALLDQSLVAGVGNIYADEALFLSGIRPTALCGKLTRSQSQRLWEAIRQVLQSGIEAGGTTFSSFKGVTGVNGNYGGEAWVYGRKGEPCKVCGTPIEQIKLAGRSAHYCENCQS